MYLTRLIYQYRSLKEARRDTRDNIFPEIFEVALLRINPDLRPADVPGLLDEINLDLQNEDPGCAFHKRLTACSGTRLIDFDNLANNSFHAVAAPRQVDT